MLVANSAGWIGALLLLVVAYHADSVGRLRATDRAYQLMNLIGSVGLGTVAATHHAWPSLAVNALWLLIAAAALASSASRSPCSTDPER